MKHKAGIHRSGLVRLGISLGLAATIGRADHVLAATLTVTSTNDNGDGSLRQAIRNAAPGDVVDFAVLGAIVLTNGQLFVTNNLSIIGPGATNLEISGNGSSRVFEIGLNVTVSISDLTISDGAAQGAAGTNNVSGPGGDGEPGLGGGILNRGTLTLANCALTFNRAFGGPGGSGYPSGAGGKAEGGGIFNGGSLTIRNSTFLGNSVVGGPGAGAPASLSGGGGNGRGGAVCNTNILIVLQSTFSSNAVTGGNGFARGFFTSGDGGVGGSADGGAICNRRTTVLLLSSFFSNLAAGGAGGSGGPGFSHSTGGLPGGNGGSGGLGRGGALTSEGGTVTMTNTTFAANRAQGGPGGAGGEGGATGCFTSSYPGPGGSGGRGGDGTGGGIYHSGASLRLFSITCSINTARGGLGGAGGLGGTTPGLGCNPPKPPRGWSGSYGTAGEGWAGGLHTPSGSTTMQNTILAANTASLTSLDMAGTVSSEGFNLIGVTNESSGWIASDLIGSATAPLDPMLGPVQDNGGPTLTMALLAGSPAIDQGKSSGLTTDQRSHLRPFDWPAVANASGGDGSDIGAFEGGPPALSIRRSGNRVVLTWPASELVFRLQNADTLPGGNTWANVSGNPVLSGGIYEITEIITGAHKFYRLINP